MSKEKHISLKEAAKISGYSPDYVGQLIRRGKLEGKQVFLNVAWVTTEEALRAYMSRQEKKSGAADRPGLVAILKRRLSMISLYRLVLVSGVGVFSCIALFLLYVLFVSIDHRIEQRYRERAEQL